MNEAKNPNRPSTSHEKIDIGLKNYSCDPETEGKY